MTVHEPHYLCGTCGDDRGPQMVSDLRCHPNGGLVCETCWDARYAEFPDQIDCSQLPRYLPPEHTPTARLIQTIADHEATIEDLRREVALLRQASSGVRVSFSPYHTSDCAIHDAPAYNPGACDCGGPHGV